MNYSQNSIKQQLELSAGMKLQLKINDNRSTMLSVRWGGHDSAKVSLHRMFLHAPQNVMEALACYLKGVHKKLAPSIKAYIEENMRRLDYTHELDLSKLELSGKVHDLQKIYEQMNGEYFDHALDLKVTWFGKNKRRRRRSVTFGLYQNALKLIKINRLMDDRAFPEFLVSFVVYHEMLHHVCPSFVDENGQKHIHTKAFKERERQHRDYDRAKKWIRDNHPLLFRSSCKII
ncbi:MAG: hypothetical protein LW832_07695 [Parachlamydia sp.]|nr:hypothetical protein [Parachlamydia sp.]